MNQQRRVRSVGRPTYGRGEPLGRPMRRGASRRPAVGLWQRRLVVLVLVAGVAAWGFAKLFAITKVTVVAGSRSDQIQAEVLKLTHESWSQGHTLTLDEGVLVSKLQQVDPLLRSVEVRRQWPHGLKVSAVLKQPSMGWSSGNQRYLLDSDGTAIGAFPAGSTLPVVNDGSNLPVTLGRQVTTPRFVAFVTALVPALHQAGVNVTSLDIKDTTFDLTAQTDKGYRLVLDTSRSVADEMSDLKAVQGVLAAQKRTPAEYLDLRIAGKAYYK